MSMNPARTFGSAFPAGIWDALLVYCTAPTLGIAAEVFLFRRYIADRMPGKFIQSLTTNGQL